MSILSLDHNLLILLLFFFFLMIRRPPRSTLSSSSAASDVYKRQVLSSITKIKDVGRTNYAAQEQYHGLPYIRCYRYYRYGKWKPFRDRWKSMIQIDSQMNEYKEEPTREARLQCHALVTHPLARRTSKQEANGNLLSQCSLASGSTVKTPSSSTDSKPTAPAD
eukprot:TRINITY_DN13967_c0_g3_i2.p1 TRINITY_DN13967_c0_g3~~TRINITY_DN13967_c0_g3_i2.p1  ORF type:complete len:164 (-),score=1.50 TRINITY_DN13967_c0_g3_i2:362-853(-)